MGNNKARIMEFSAGPDTTQETQATAAKRQNTDLTKHPRTDIRKLVACLMKSYAEEDSIIKVEAKNQIGKAAISEILRDLQILIFPGFFGEKQLRADSIEYYTGELVEKLFNDLTTQITRALNQKPQAASHADVGAEAERAARGFLERVPDIRRIMATDVDAAYDGDPAAYNRDEVILSYPGIFAIMAYRLAHELHQLDVPLIPRMMTECAHDRTGVDIHPGATVGHHFFIDHGTGIVIGETTVIGNFVKIYQGVTLGALSTRGGQLLQGVKRHPTIEDHVTIYSGATIMGGGTVIGEGVVIGANAFIVKSVPERTNVSVKNPELQFASSEKKHLVELAQDGFWDWMI